VKKRRDAPPAHFVPSAQPWPVCRVFTRMNPVRLLSVLPLALIAAGCAEEPAPSADPAQIERLVASLEADPALPPGIEKKLQKADRIAGTVARIAPEKIDPDVAVALIAR
jgi:PBP1b-binding outer membrane lipoprotein LpoB